MLSARHHRDWRVFSALRPVIAILLIVLMAGNAVAGSFSGFAHVHDREHSGHHHHHDDGEDHHHHDADQLASDSTPLVVDVDHPTITASDQAPEQGQIHIHDPIVTLGLSKVAHWALKPVRPAWEPPSPDQLISHQRIPSERPPRAA